MNQPILFVVKDLGNIQNVIYLFIFARFADISKKTLFKVVHLGEIVL